MVPIGPEKSELFALKYGQIAEFDFVYTLASANKNHSTPNLVKIYLTIRCRTCLIMVPTGPEQPELFALE